VKKTNVLDFEVRETYEFIVTVTDDGLDPPQLQDTCKVTINVTDVNEPPTFPTSITRTIEENKLGNVGAPVEAGDPDTKTPQILSYNITSGNDLGYFHVKDEVSGSGKYQGQLFVKSGTVPNFEAQSSFTLGFSAVDNGVPPQTTTTLITVVITDVNEAPVIASPPSLSVAEESTVGTPVGSPLQGNDEDNDDVGTPQQTLSWSVAAHQDHQYFDIESSSGQIQVKKVMDYEVHQKLTITVQFSDGTLQVNKVIEVLINDVNEAPSLTDKIVTLNENSNAGTQVGQMLYSDPDNMDSASVKNTFVFTIIAGDDNNIFDWNKTVLGRLEVRRDNMLNYEGVQSYVLNVRITDNGGMYDDATFRVNLNNVNEQPSLQPCTQSVAENSPIGTQLVGSPCTGHDVDAGDTAQLVYSIVGGDNITFAIDPDAATVTVNAGGDHLNYELKQSSKIIVRATDPGSLYDDAEVSIIINDVNEPPVIHDVNRTVPEATQASGLNMQVGLPLQGVASDVDIGLPGGSDSLKFAITGGNRYKDVDVFAINENTGQITVASYKTIAGPCENGNVVNCTLRYADEVAHVGQPYSYVLAVSVTDETSNTASATVTITVSDQNFPPVFLNVSSFDLAENVAASTVIGTVQATDADNDVLEYYISYCEPTSGLERFEINKDSGKITVKDNPARPAPENSLINYENANVYKLTVAAKDTPNNLASSLTGSTEVIVNIKDINEKPTMSNIDGTGTSNRDNDARFILENQAQGALVGAPIFAVDPDANPTLTYSAQYILSTLFTGRYKDMQMPSK
jgi:hypothetical protein